MDVEQSAPPATVSRRRMLQAGAAASAGLWVAPAILSMDAAAAATGSCGAPPRRVDFSRFNPGYLPANFTSDDGSVAISFTMSDPNNVQVPLYAGRIATMNTLDHCVQTAMQNATGGDQVRLRFDFSVPVCPQFYLADVDRDTSASNPFEDTVTVIGRLGGGPRIDPASMAVGGAQTQINPRTVRGLYPTGGADGNVLVTFDQPIDRLVIRHRDVSTFAGFQWVGIHDFHWC